MSLNVVQIIGTKGTSLILKEIRLQSRDFLFFVLVIVSKIGEVAINCFPHYSSVIGQIFSSQFINECFHGFSKEDRLLEMNVKVESWILC
jgi:hypothetical protein